MIKNSFSEDFPWAQYNFIFVPGGPWISGEYWDRYISHLPNDCSAHRYVLLNHEGRYSLDRKISRQELENDFNLFVRSHLDQKKKNVIIAHSYGAWLSIAAVTTDLAKQIHKFIFVCMPFSLERTEKFQSRYEILSMPYTDNETFSTFFKKIAPLYFVTFEEDLFDQLFAKSYMQGNEDILYQKFDIQSLVETTKRDMISFFIFGLHDRMTESIWQIYQLKNFSAVTNSAHFPMLENSEEFTECIFNALI